MARSAVFLIPDSCSRAVHLQPASAPSERPNGSFPAHCWPICCVFAPAQAHARPMSSAVIEAAGLRELVSTLVNRGYRVLGPTLSDNAIELPELTSADDLPRHAGATTLGIAVTVGDELIINVADNGRGLPDEVATSGLVDPNKPKTWRRIHHRQRAPTEEEQYCGGRHHYNCTHDVRAERNGT